MSKHIELAKKLKALAEKGIGGEKVNAEKMLNALLKKHNITIEEIEGEKTQDFYFKVTDKSHWKILLQIIKGVGYEIPCYGEIPKTKVAKYKLKGNYIITCTLAEYLEIDAKFNFYLELYKKELIIFNRAFISANDLGVDNPNGEIDFSDFDLEEEIRVINLASNIQKGEFHKQLVAPK